MYYIIAMSYDMQSLINFTSLLLHSFIHCN